MLKTIKEFPMYKISESGDVYSSYNGRWGKSDKLKRIAIRKTEKGYLDCSLSKNGINRTRRISRLVAKAFIPNPENKPEVNHIDGNKENNHASNLEWCTHQENVDHSWELGLQNPQNGERVNTAKVSKKDVLDIRRRYKEEDIFQHELADEYNLTVTSIHNIINRKTWSHI